MEVLDIFSEGFDILVNCIRCHAPNLHQPVVLDEYCVAGQVAMDYWGVATEKMFSLFGQKLSLILNLCKYDSAERI